MARTQPQFDTTKVVIEKGQMGRREFGQGSRSRLYCQSLQCGTGQQTDPAEASPFQV